MIVTFTTNRRAKLLIFPKVGDKTIKVRFTPPALFGNVGKAEFTTSDKALIKAMKADSMFGVEYFVKEEIADEGTPIAEEAKKETDYYALCDSTKEIFHEDSVVDIATAQNWLQREHGTVFKARKAETIKEEAAKVYNTVFPNFK